MEIQGQSGVVFLDDHPSGFLYGFRPHTTLETSKTLLSISLSDRKNFDGCRIEPAATRLTSDYQNHSIRETFSK